MAFTTVANLALFLNRDIDLLSAMELSQIEALIPYIDGVINNYCGWNILATDYTDKRFNGTGTSSLDLRLSPINTLTSVRERAADGTFTENKDSVEILEDGTIQFLPWIGGTFTAGNKNWFVTFNAGYAQDKIPAELTYAANYLISINFNKIVDENMGAEEEKFSDISFKNNNIELPVTVKRVLDRYRLVSVF